MKQELFGLRNKKTKEIVFTYCASSQFHKALFFSKKKAEQACKWNDEYEPYRITCKENAIEQAEWIETPFGNEIICSYCKSDWNVFDNETYRFIRCPNCGAKMKDM